MRLRAGTLSHERSGSSCFREGGFTSMNQCLRTHFAFGDFEVLDQLTPAALAPLDLFIMCTTEGPAPTEEELTCLRAWVAAGGALITSAFSNWSAFGHYAAQTVEWLGLQTLPREPFGTSVQHRLQPLTCGAPAPSNAGLLCQHHFQSVR